MSYQERIQDYLWSVAPNGATNSQIAHALGISSHQTVYMTTQDLLRRQAIRAAKERASWVFYALDAEVGSIPAPMSSADSIASPDPALVPARAFEITARGRLGERFGTNLQPGIVGRVPKRFDFVSADQQIVGDAKYYTLVRGVRLPPAKFATIAEYVWLLEKTEAATRFLVFGNDREVPIHWLARYGTLVRDVQFFFLSDVGHLEVLQ